MQKILLDVEMLDGTIHEDIRVILADMIRHSEVAQRHGWPSIDNDQIRGGAFLAYAAMTRTELYPKDRGFDDFVNEVAMVSADFGEEVDPTQTATPGA